MRETISKQELPVRVRFWGTFWLPQRKFSPSFMSNGRFCGRWTNSVNGFFVVLLGRGGGADEFGLIEKA